MAQPLFRTPPNFEGEFPGATALATECFINYGLLSGGVIAAFQELVLAEGMPSTAAFNVLAILDGAGQPLSPSTIADRMLVSRATVTGVLDSLERRELIDRRGHEGDGRKRIVAITPAGGRIVRRLLPAVHQFEAQVMGALTASEQGQLLRMLAKLQHNLAEVAPGTRLRTPG